jgi:hypothetical protein
VALQSVINHPATNHCVPTRVLSFEFDRHAEVTISDLRDGSNAASSRTIRDFETLADAQIQHERLRGRHQFWLLGASLDLETE